MERADDLLPVPVSPSRDHVRLGARRDRNERPHPAMARLVPTRPAIGLVRRVTRDGAPTSARTTWARSSLPATG